MKRITVIYQPGLNGEARAVLQTIRAIKPSYDPTTIKLSSQERIGLKKYLLVLFRWWIRCVTEVSAIKPSIIMSSIPQAMFPLLIIPIRTPIIYLYHGNRSQISIHQKGLTPFQKILRGIDRRIIKYVLQHATSVIAPSDAINNKLVSEEFPTPKNLHLIPNYISATYGNNLPSKIMLREKWKIPHTALALCYVGRLDQKKGVLELVNALIKNKTLWDNVLIAAPVSTQAEKTILGQIQKIITKHHMDKRINILIKYPYIREIYRLADVCFLPSQEELFPLVMLESITAGCLFAGSNVGKMAEMNRHIPAAAIKQPHHSGFDNSIVKILHLSSEERKQLVIAQQKYVHQFTKNRVRQEFKNLIQKLSS